VAPPSSFRRHVCHCDSYSHLLLFRARTKHVYISQDFSELGGPAVSNYEKLKDEGLDFQSKFNELLEACE
jgi:hypothetical protein